MANSADSDQLAVKANSADPDQLAVKTPANLDLHCLQKPAYQCSAGQGLSTSLDVKRRLEPLSK